MAKERESAGWASLLRLDPDEVFEFFPPLLSFSSCKQVKKAEADAVPFDMYAELKDVLADPTAQKFFVQHLVPLLIRYHIFLTWRFFFLHHMEILLESIEFF